MPLNPKPSTLDLNLENQPLTSNFTQQNPKPWTITPKTAASLRHAPRPHSLPVNPLRIPPPRLSIEGHFRDCISGWWLQTNKRIYQPPTQKNKTQTRKSSTLTQLQPSDTLLALTASSSAPSASLLHAFSLALPPPTSSGFGAPPLLLTSGDQPLALASPGSVASSAVVNSLPEIRNPKFVARNAKRETRNLKPEFP